MIEALYLHIPFCVSRCSYCDFKTCATDDEARMDAYVDALSLQLRRASRAGLLSGVKTIYIGGGTPTHLGSRRLNSLIYLISLSVNLENVKEFTIEANPESIDAKLVADLYALGVNRFSIGAQSFDDTVLRGYGRVHDAAAIESAVRSAQTRTNEVSLDLICGGPGQSMESWKTSLQRALELEITHLSVYPLMLEEATRLARSVEAGECAIADEDLQADMMLAAEDVLTNAGFKRYEVASYAIPGHESLHNLAYWPGTEYLGLGAAASSMLQAKTARELNKIALFSMEENPVEVSDEARIRIAAHGDDIAYSNAKGCPACEIEILSPYEAIVEDLMLGMRMSAGVSCGQVEGIEGALPVFEDLVKKGLVIKQGNRFKTTRRGWLLGNEVFSAIWDIASESCGPAQ